MTNPKSRVSIILWALAGTVIAVIVMAFYQFILIKQAGTVGQFTVSELLLVEMRLPFFALWGCAIGAAIGIVEKLVLAVRGWYKNRKVISHYDVTSESADEKIQRIRSARADRYLKDKSSAPPTQPNVENVITALNGTLTYKVLAYRNLSEQEAAEVVATRLKSGELREPAPGGIAVVATDIGKADADV